MALDPSGRWLLGASSERGHAVGYLRDRLAPPSTRPLALRRPGGDLSGVDFHPGGRWLATTHQSQVTLWWLGGPWARVYESRRGVIQAFAFTPDGAILAGTDDGLQRWPVTPEHGEPRVVSKLDQALLRVEIAPDRRHALLAAWHRVLSVPLEGGAPREVAAFSPNANLTAFALAPDGRRLVAAPHYASAEERVLREWDLATGRSRVVAPIPVPDRTAEGTVGSLAFLDDQSVVASVKPGGLLVFDLARGTHRVACPTLNGSMVVSRRRDFAIGWGTSGAPSVLLRCDLGRGEETRLDHHGEQSQATVTECVALDPTETLVASGDADGVVRVGPVSGGEPHLFFGHEGPLFACQFSPDGRWLASAGADGTLRLWPVPDVARPPLHALPRESLLARLGAFTNLRAVPAADAPGGYRVEPGPFAGWSLEPEW